MRKRDRMVFLITCTVIAVMFFSELALFRIQAQQTTPTSKTLTNPPADVNKSAKDENEPIFQIPEIGNKVVLVNVTIP